jgi:5-methylcytosine-specific restriction endonuclease McrA
MKKIPQFKPKKGVGTSQFKKKSPYNNVNWVEFRNEFLRINPRCYACGNRATVADHFVAFKGNKELFWKPDNFIPLCKLCHDTVTGYFDQFAVPKTKEKLEWLNHQRAKNEIDVRVKIVVPKIEG